MKSYEEIKARNEQIRKQWLSVNAILSDASGIYILTREENGFKYAYVGQAKHVLSRLIDHSNGYDMWIDLSIRKHGLFSKANPTGWMVKSYSCPESTLNHFETLFIREYAGKGYQMRNKTSGGQCAGKTGITANKPAKGYYDGVAQGRANVQRELRDMFRVSLEVSIKGKPNKNKEKALRRFLDFIGDENNG